MSVELPKGIIMNATRVRMGLALGLAGAGVALCALGNAPSASADPTSYLQSLNNGGLTIYDAGLALNWGYAICRALNEADGNTVAANFYAITDYRVTLHAADVFVVSAVENLCPWHDHRSQLA